MLHDAYEAFRDCGWSSWICLLFFLPAFLVGLVGLAFARRAPSGGRVLGIVAIVLGVLAMGVAVFGRQNDIGKVMAATSSQAIDPSQRDRIRAEGLREANECLEVGAFTGGLPFVLGAIALAMGSAALKKQT